MRRIHRWVSIIVGVFMILIAATGVALQVEMMDGGPKGRPAASRTLDDAQVHAMVDTLLAAAHAQAPGKPVVELSLSVLGAGMGGAGPARGVVAIADPAPRQIYFDADTGSPDVSAQEARGLHFLLLDLHRALKLGTAGTWISVLCGLSLLFLGISGLVIYGQMLGRRWKAGLRQPFW
ncbi:PepSY-associated TM helix domain-containing protein [Azospirillum sp. B4]|uniref:PepSY-associated TM helix domain-containing protein n=1 Tax=Azospirillum sp. B4 TaxID=95605 RepID=UPI00034B877B|nr:PepSY-associated TM helix domain-containing protein [Azospirillum sp. B4]